MPILRVKAKDNNNDFGPEDQDLAEIEVILHVPTGLSDKLLRLISYGLLFERQWEMAGTESEWSLDP